MLDVARSFTIVASYRVSELSLLALKSQLAGGDPLLMGIDVYPSFDNAQGVATITGTGDVRGYHAIVLVGYDDAKHAFRIQNSWGPDWGDQGRAWIDYNTLLAATHEAYRVVPPVAPELITSVAPPSRFGIVNDRTQEFHLFLKQSMVAAVDPVTVVDSHGQFGVGVAQYTSLAPAQSQARSISEGPTGLTAKILKRSNAGKTSYAVLIAADLDSDEAILVIERAKRLGFDKSFMITFPGN